VSPAGGAATLARLGLDREELLAGRIAEGRLAELIAGPDGAALAAALGELASPAVAATLVALEPHAGEREARREIRRALYRLRQRGVPTPVRAMEATPATRGEAAPAAEGLVSHVDGRGDRLVWIIRPLPGGGSLLVAAQVNEPAGLRDLQVAEVGRKQIRAARRHLETDAKLRLVPADWRTLDALLVEAQGRSGGDERQRDYLRVRPRLTREAAREPAEPVSSRVERPGLDEAAGLAASSAALLDEPEFAGWLPEPAALAPVVDEIAAIRESPILLSPVQQRERVGEILRRAAATLFPPAVLARRLEATAYVLAETGRAAAARLALALAVRLRARPEDADTPFTAALVEHAVGSVLTTETTRHQEERRDSLVMTPGEFLKARSSARPPRTRA
jgi:hypothetical protein